MKTLFTSRIILSSLLIVLLNFACKKSDPGWELADPAGFNLDGEGNKFISNYDAFILWPRNAIDLGINLIHVGYGRYDAHGPIGLKWRIISGPNLPQLQVIDSIDNNPIKVSLLQIGVYEYEVSFDTAYGIYNKDTGRIIVDSLSNPPKEFIYPKQNWILDYGYGKLIEVKDVYEKILPESAFHAFIKRENSSNWEELSGAGGYYFYRFDYVKGSKGMITIRTDILDTTITDKPDIKLVY